MRQTALNICFLAFIAALTVIGANSWAKSFVASAQPSPQVQAQDQYTLEALYDQAEQDLILHVTEVAESMNACDLVLAGMTYATDSQTLSLKFDGDFCAIDRVGHRTGTLKWHLPMNLRGTGEINLEVNGLALGKLVFDQANGTLHVNH